MIVALRFETETVLTCDLITLTFGFLTSKLGHGPWLPSYKFSAWYALPLST